MAKQGCSCNDPMLETKADHNRATRVLYAYIAAQQICSPPCWRPRQTITKRHALITHILRLSCEELIGSLKLCYARLRASSCSSLRSMNYVYAYASPAIEDYKRKIHSSSRTPSSST